MEAFLTRPIICKYSSFHLSVEKVLVLHHDWLKKNRATLLSNQKVNQRPLNRDALAHIFPYFVQVTRNYLEFLLVHCIVFVVGDWLE